MRIHKPLALTALHAPFQHDGKVRLVVVIGAMASLDGASLDQEQTLWKLLAEAPGSSGSLDEVKPKVRGEALVSGYACAPEGRPAPIVAVRLAVGPIDKELWVAGDRVWRDGVPSEPAPFERMPVTWDRAFGGEGFGPNPVGKGLAPVRAEAGGEVHPLPNVEIARKLVTSPRERPAPAGFAPIDPSWPERMRKLGTYDDRWLRTRYPELAEDFDPTYFNVAPADQWIEGSWAGGEPFVIENMHPTRPRIEGRLPAFSARCLVTRRGGPELGEDVALRCDTVWFLPHEERVILLYRGAIEVADEEASDVDDLVAALEHRGRPKAIDHYRHVRATRLDKDRGVYHMLRDVDLIPEGVRGAKSAAVSDMDALLARERLPERNQRRRAQRELDASRERLRALGVDPDAHLPRSIPPEDPDPDLEDLGAVVETLQEQAAKAAREAEQRREDAMKQLRELCGRHGVDLDAHLERSKREGGGPPRFSADAELARLRDLAARVKDAGLAPPEVLAKLEDPELPARLRSAEAGVRDAYRRTAHHMPPASLRGGDEAARLRREVEAALATGEDLAGRDLTGADLAGLDLSGRDLSSTFLERARLAGCSLRGANLEGAVLARADLTGADLHGARARGANLGEADLTGARLTGGVDLTEAVLARATLKGADLTGARLDRAELSEARFDATIFAKVEAEGLTVLKSDLRGLDLRGARLVDCNLLEVDLSGVDGAGATLTGTVLLDTRADGARLCGADLRSLRVVRVEQGSSLARVDLRGADLRGANLRGVDLAGADLRDADLRGADLSWARLEGADLSGARAVELRLVKADLTGASLARADLMYALMGGAVVRGASFEEANVFRADAAKMKGDDRTSFRGANVKQVRVVPERGGHG